MSRSTEAEPTLVLTMLYDVGTVLHVAYGNRLLASSGLGGEYRNKFNMALF